MTSSSKIRAIRLAQATDFKFIRNAGVSHRCVHSVYVSITKLSQNGTWLKVQQWRIAKMAGYSRSQTKLAIKALKKFGYLWVKHNYNKNEYGQSRRGVSSMGLRKIFSKISAHANCLRSEKNPLLSFSLVTGEISGIPIPNEPSQKTFSEGVLDLSDYLFDPKLNIMDYSS